ncbi:hypothetical protein [Streptomyces iranensis]|uniref:Uncharacterized protein n=1 Tax=Streptomyces iranensis TaxID=576784 RepID=A0A060ZPH9_9ACTN|nr:hypothetical protein [Streptomyces iranensis]MBP2068406.1 hypothetical protein [Streptomyces iranensis]CDR08040.1 predicted protein [Streptomyces iranensis]
MTRRVLPYRIPPEDVVVPEAWLLVNEAGELDMPEALPDWDYRMNLHLRRRVRVDLDRARSGSGLPDDAALMLSAVWTATGSNLGGPAQHVRLAEGGTRTVDFDVRLRGADLGGLLLLDTALVLAERRSDARPSSPRRAGSVLWSDRDSLRLQGDAPQFPMAVIDFARTSFPDEAAWHLQISGGMESATMGSLLLLVNERNTITTTAFENAGKPRPVDRIVLSAVYADAARVMIEHALSVDDFGEDADFPDGSLGATLLSLFEQLFPGQSITDVRLRQRQSPALFASDLQAAVKIFEVS